MVNEILEKLMLDEYRLLAFALEYFVILIAIISDLIAGLRKAKTAHKARTSYALRKTLDKVIQYYGSAIFATFVDVLLIFAIGGLKNEMGLSLFSFPFVTLIVTFFICWIEYRSMREKRDVKINARIDEATKAISEFLKENDNIEIIEKILKIINESKKITEK